MVKSIKLNQDKFLNKFLYFYILNLLEFFSFLLDDDFDLCILWRQVNYNDDKSFKKTFNIFLKNYKSIKDFLKLKRQKMYYNKIYKIFYNVNLYYRKENKIMLNITLFDLHKDNKFLFLPYIIKIDYTILNK